MPLAIVGKPFVALALVVFCVAAWIALLATSLTVVLLTGNRDMHWSWFTKPSFGETPFTEFSKYSAITHDRIGRQRAAWRMRTFLIPWVQIVLAGGTYLLAWWLLEWEELATPLQSIWLHLYLGLALIYLVCAGIWTLLELPPSKRKMRRFGKQEAERLRKQEEKRAKELASFKARYAPLVCDGSGKVAERPAFTWQNPRPATIRWYQDLKAAWCKQYPIS